jgi:Fe-S-cluster containining protein
MTVPENCLHCGVCCFSKSGTYVRVSGGDWMRLGDEAEKYARFVGNRAYLRMTDGHCAALDLRPRPGGGLEYFCMIYDRRPQVCRDLRRGSRECLGELDTKQDQVRARK